MLNVESRSTTRCGDCGEDLGEDMRFCPHCGHEVDATTVGDSENATTIVLAEPVEPDEQPVEAPPRGRRLWPRGVAGRGLAIGLATLLVAGGAYAGYTAYLNHREYKAEVAAAFGVADRELSAAVADLQDVKRTAGIRAVAERASAGSSSLDEYLPDLGEQEAVRARTVGAALAQIGSLSTLDADTLGVWKDDRQALVDALDGVVGVDGQQRGVSGSDGAVAAVDKVVRRGRTKLADWRRERAAAVSQRRSDLAAFDAYVSSMNAQIASYASMRDDTAAELDNLRNDASDTYLHEPLYSLFSSAMYDRISVRDAMNGLSVPGGVQSQHATIVGVVSDGIAGMDQLLGALDDNNACDSYWDDSCYLFGQPLWDDFQASSDSVTERYGAAVDSWRASLPGARSAIESRELPKKPVV